MSVFEPELEEGVESETRVKSKTPKMYKVLLHNDDYTTMEFVVEILIRTFNKTPQEATRIMLSVHEKGMGICGVYTYEVAETKVRTVMLIARERGFPLMCTMEEE